MAVAEARCGEASTAKSRKTLALLVRLGLRRGECVELSQRHKMFLPDRRIEQRIPLRFLQGRQSAQRVALVFGKTFAASA